jgi:PTS system mannose-specific IIA component
MSVSTVPGTGFLVIAHGELAFEMVRTLEFITGQKSGFKSVAIDHAVDMDKAREIITSAIDEIMTDKGVIVLTDLFGGAPSNIAMSLMDEKKLEIVAGVNLPILIHAVMLDESLTLKEKAQKLRDYGRGNIFIASEVLAKGK